MRRLLLLLAVVTSAGAANAAEAVDPVTPSAALPDARAQAAPVEPRSVYTSPFATYRRFKDEAVGNWAQANDRVRAIGGWRAYARESQAPQPEAQPSRGGDNAAPAKATANVPAPATAAGDHAQHHP
jgi:hypothetical protein